MKKKTKLLIGATALTSFSLTYLSASLALIYSTFKGKNSFQSHRILLDTQHDLKTVELTTKSYDGYILKAKLILSEKPSNKVIIGIHDYHSDAFHDFQNFIEFYHHHGYSILLPDNRGHGESEGKYVGFGWLDRLDILEWIQEIKRYFHYQKLQIVLHGQSMGASSLLMLSGEVLPSDIKCIISENAYTNIIDEFKDILKRSKIPPHLFLPALKHLSKPIIGYNIQKVDALKQVKKSHTPTLFIHDAQNKTIPVSMVLSLYKYCHAKKELLILEDNSPIIRKEAYVAKIASFLDTYIN